MTTLRPHLVLVSETTKRVVLLGLTVPSEVQLEEAFKRKMAKYEGLASKYRSSGWKNRYNPMNVGCRGFAGQLLHRALKALGVMGLHN